jgi:hypothetical protein
MKNKWVTILLISAVLLIWGVVFFRVLKVVDGDGEETHYVKDTKVKTAFNDFTLPGNSQISVLTRRDPFGIIIPKDTVLKKKYKADSIKQQKAPVIIPNWDFVKYLGFIRNPETKKLIAIMRINGNESMLTEGETRDGVSLVKNFRDSLKIKYKGEIKFIRVRPASL